MKTVRKILRSIQIFFPFIQDYRFKFQFFMRSALGKVHEKDFDALTILGRGLYVDIGANRGETVQSIKMKVPDATIFAFEPNKIICDKLKANFTSDNVKIFNYGLSDSQGELELFVPFYRNYMFDGLASFNIKNASDWLESRMFFYKEKLFKIKKLKCSLYTLDSFRLKPLLVKIDVQGFEYHVLKGAEKTIETAKPIFLIESPQPTEIDYLYDFGYNMYHFDGHKFQPGMGELNTFFIPQEKKHYINRYV